MEFVNAMYNYVDKNQTIRRDVAEEAMQNLLKVLAPFTPHIAAELWQQAGFDGDVHQQEWPHVDETALQVDEIELPIQVNGKVRDRITVPVEMEQDKLRELALERPHVKAFVEGKQVVKFIVVPKKIINIVVK